MIILPKDVSRIIEILEDKNYEAYVVGGCVRDKLLGHIPKDWDIATSAKPNMTMKILSSKNISIFPTGIKYGTISAFLNKKAYEITTYRIEKDYLNHRKPSEVDFTQNIKYDLSRRDFTINALAYHPKRGLLDYFGGLKDLENKIIKAIGKPKNRFDEDALRILRAIRFASKLGFKIEPKTKNQIFKQKNLLSQISRERILNELKEIIKGKNIKKILNEYLEIIYATLDIPFSKSLDKFTGTFISNCSKKYILRFLVLFMDIFEGDKKNIEMTLKNLKFSNKDKNSILNLIDYYQLEVLCNKIVMKKYLNQMGIKDFEFFLELKIAYIKTYEKNKAKIKFLKETINNIPNLIKEGVFLNDLKINGNDIKKLGIKQGIKIKKILNLALIEVINEKIPNDKNSLINFCLANKNFK